MIHVLFLLSHTEKAGGQVVIYNLVKYIDRNQFKPFVGHVDFRKGQFIHEFNKLGVIPKDFGARHLRNLPVTIAVILRLVRFIRDNSIDVVFTSNAHNHIYAALTRRLRPVPIVTYVMGYYQARFKDNPLITQLALWLGADYYLAASYSCLESLEKLISPNTPNRVIYHGIDKDFLLSKPDGLSVRNKLGLKDNDKLISMIARLQPYKGQDIFLRAAGLIIKQYPQAHFCLVGDALFGMDEDYPGQLRNLIKELGLSEQCWLVGQQENVQDWISASDIIVHPTKAPDVGPIVVKEAMCLGKPVVATSCGAHLEYIEDGLTGILCQPNSVEDLAAKISKLLDNERLAMDIGRNAQGIALERFNVQRMAREVEAVLKSVL